MNPELNEITNELFSKDAIEILDSESSLSVSLKNVRVPDLIRF